MVGCSILGCKNRSDRNRQGLEGLTFHTFPHSPELKNKWIEATGRLEWQPSKHSKLCSSHFDKDSIIVKNSVTRIKPLSVPCINVYPQSAAVAADDKISEQKEKPSSKPKRSCSDNEKMVSCAVPGCTSSRSNNPKKYSFHQFPQNARLRSQWLKMMDKKDWEPRKYSTICSKHFDEKCFTVKTKNKNKLCNDSVPTLFMPNSITPKIQVISLITDSSSEASETESSTEQTKNKRFLRSSSLKKNKAKNIQGNKDQQKKETKMSGKKEHTECRTCLEKHSLKHLYSVFKTRKNAWEDVEYTIAAELANIAGVKVSSTDTHSKYMCAKCFNQIKSLHEFIAKVKKSDSELKQRSENAKMQDDSWPRPIQLDKNINGDMFGTVIDVDIKQEVLTEDEESQDAVDSYRGMTLDIKVEPEEMTEPQPIKVTVNGTISEDQMGEHRTIVSNGCDTTEDQQNKMQAVKREPLSEDEGIMSEIPLECMLCAKNFNSVSGLKAHVIAQHSYKTVKRKASNLPSPEKKPRLKCDICLRTFTTSTDLMVHETCHNKSVCYGCHKNFDTFAQLTKHRKFCKALRNKEIQKPKSLEDVMRPHPAPTEARNKPETLFKCQMCNKEFTDVYYLKIHHEVVHESSFECHDEKTPKYMEIETLESIFGETENSNESEVRNSCTVKECSLPANILDKPESASLKNNTVSTYLADESLLALRELLNDDSVNSPSDCQMNEVVNGRNEGNGVKAIIESEKTVDSEQCLPSEPVIEGEVESEQANVESKQANAESEQDNFENTTHTNLESELSAIVSQQTEQATVESGQATVDSEQATVDNEQSNVDSEQANAESEQANAESEQANAESEQANAENEQANAESEQAILNNQQTNVESEQTTINDYQATADSEQAIADTKQAITDNEQAIADNEQAIAEDAQTTVDSADSKQATSDTEKATIDSEEATDENHQKTTESDQITAEREQEIVGCEQPTIYSEQTPDETEKNEISSIEIEQNITENDKQHEIENEESYIDSEIAHIDSEQVQIDSEQTKIESEQMEIDSEITA